MTATRSQHETPQDRTRAAVVVAQLEDQWSVNAVKLHSHQRINYALLRDNDVQAMLEIKIRRCTVGRFAETMISLDKFNAGVDYWQKNGIPFLIAFQFSDKLLYYRHNQSNPVSYEHGGRTTDTRDAGDIELVAMIPTYLLRSVEGSTPL